jgi:hypothetical protein
MYSSIIDMEEAIKIIGPLVVMIGLTEEDTRILLKYVDAMSARGISGKDAGMLLRKYLKEYKNV